MRFGEIWDYFMRRKLLLLLVLTAIILILIWGGKLFSKGTETEVGVEIPKTGGLIMDSENSPGCGAAPIGLPSVSVGGGENMSQDESVFKAENANTAPWEAEAISAYIDENAQDGMNAEVLIIVIGAAGILAVLVAAKFIFDRYVR